MDHPLRSVTGRGSAYVTSAWVVLGQALPAMYDLRLKLQKASLPWVEASSICNRLKRSLYCCVEALCLITKAETTFWGLLRRLCLLNHFKFRDSQGTVYQALTDGYMSNEPNCHHCGVLVSSNLLQFFVLRSNYVTTVHHLPYILIVFQFPFSSS